jgi:CIC family chloride channel protein
LICRLHDWLHGHPAGLLALAIGIGSGAGIGAALGSTLGQLLRVPESRLRLLVACGAAAGISATFNAPIAGVVFALELILRDVEAESSVPSAATTRSAASCCSSLARSWPRA